MGSEDTEHTYWWTIIYGDAEGKVIKERKCTDVRADYVTVEVGENGNWWIDGKDSGKPATPGKVMIEENEAGFVVITITQPGGAPSHTFVLPMESSDLKGVFFRSNFNYRGYQAMNFGYQLIKPINVGGTPSIADNGENFVDEGKYIRQTQDEYELIYDLNPTGFNAAKYIKEAANLSFEVKANKEVIHTRALVDATERMLEVKGVDFSKEGQLKITVNGIAPEALGGSVDADTDLELTTLARLKVTTTNAEKFGNKQVLSDWATVYNDITECQFAIGLNKGAAAGVQALPFIFQDNEVLDLSVDYKGELNLAELLSLRMKEKPESESGYTEWKDASEFMAKHGLKFEYYLMSQGDNNMRLIKIDGENAARYDVMSVSAEGVVTPGTDKVRPNLAVNCSQAIQVRAVDDNGVIVALGFVRIGVTAEEKVACIEETWKEQYSFVLNGHHDDSFTISAESLKKGLLEALAGTYGSNKYNYGIVEAILAANYDLSAEFVQGDPENFVIEEGEDNQANPVVRVTKKGCLTEGAKTFKIVYKHSPETVDVDALPTDAGWFPIVPECVSFEVTVNVVKPEAAINAGIAEALNQKVVTYWTNTNPLTGEVHATDDIQIATVQEEPGVGAVGKARVTQGFKTNFILALMKKLQDKGFEANIDFKIDMDKVMPSGKKFGELYPGATVLHTPGEADFFVSIPDVITDEGVTIPMQLIAREKDCQNEFLLMAFDVVMRAPAKLQDAQTSFSPALNAAENVNAVINFDVLDVENNNAPIYENGEIVNGDRAKYLFGRKAGFAYLAANVDIAFAPDATMSEDLIAAAQDMITKGLISYKLTASSGVGDLAKPAKLTVTYKPGTTPVNLIKPVTFVATVKVKYGKLFQTQATFKYVFEPRK
ncbi:hypothetical protein HQ38_03085 [Porphyromonas crevioricanis]|uniref:Uncharacterized protein n=2 Tax=Porphyromonas crevioricanis TaxID=393921 RepID=A0AB34PH65_9PORP|nr:hypothetical protein HQ38_03085 [Porphyromonas crevioricanis]